MDEYKLEMNWNQEELEQWALAARYSTFGALFYPQVTVKRRRQPHFGEI